MPGDDGRPAEQFHPRLRPHHRLSVGHRHGHPPGRRHGLFGGRHHALLRFAAGQGHGLGADPRPGDPPHGPRAARVPGARRQHQHRLRHQPAETSDLSGRHLYDQVHRHDGRPVRLQEASGPGDQDPDLSGRHQRERASRNGGPRPAPGPGPRAGPARPQGRPRARHPPAAGDPGRPGRGRLDGRPDPAADHRHHDARRASVAAGDTDAVDRHDPRGAQLCREPAAAVQRGMLGGRDLRRGLPLPAGMPLAAPARHPCADAQPDDADAAARVERRGLHQLPRQRGAVLRETGRRNRGRCVPRLRQPELGREHARRDGRRDRSGKICEGTVCYTGNMLDPDRSKYDLSIT